MKNDQGDTEDERDTETPSLFSASDYVGITPDELAEIQKNIAMAQKNLADPSISEDMRELYKEIIFEICSPQTYNRHREYLESLRNIFATIEQTLNQPVIPGVSSFSQKFDNYPGILEDLEKHIQRMDHRIGSGISLSEEDIAREERLRDAEVLPRLLPEDELNNLIVGKFGKGAMDVLDPGKIE